MGPRFESVKVHQWPVGQVVKTEASHAFNIGSNPVRVTNKAGERRKQREVVAKATRAREKALEEKSFDIEGGEEPPG